MQMDHFHVSSLINLSSSRRRSPKRGAVTDGNDVERISEEHGEMRGGEGGGGKGRKEKHGKHGKSCAPANNVVLSNGKFPRARSYRHIW